MARWRYHTYRICPKDMIQWFIRAGVAVQVLKIDKQDVFVTARNKLSTEFRA